jgi:formylglycine-generating enzyme required for sulfatase activity/dienelactone hydrolase
MGQSMTPERWKLLEEIYHTARARQPEDCAAYLAEACGNDEDLRRQIESLLVHGEVLSKLGSGAPSLASSQTLEKGTMVGPYRIEEKLDSGGMGTVYRANDTRLGRVVAVKIGFAQFSDRFYREARAIAALNHPNVCTLHDIGSTPEIPAFLVMEFVEGETLARRLQSGLLPVPECLQIARMMAGALAAAHAREIVHRDLKPANVKITPQGVVKVLDFGLAKGFPVAPADQPTELLTAPGTVLGTAAYMSPEHAAGKDADARSDVFAFGVVLYEMLSGRRPFEGSTSADVIASILKDEPPPLKKSGISERLQRIVSRCLQKSPEQRYPSAAELYQDLDTLIKGQESKRFLSARAALAAAILLVIMTAGYFFVQSYRRQTQLRWVEGTAIPEITKRLQEHRALAARKLFKEAERIAPDSSLLYKLSDGVAVTGERQFQTTPPGAKIYISDYTAAAGENLSEWEFIGESPIVYRELPDWGYYRIRVVKEGFSTADWTCCGTRTIQLTLQPENTAPPGMVWVPETSSTAIPPSVALPGFWLDRYEVTNRQFQEFVDAGGYRSPQYWTEDFFEDGQGLPWEKAMDEFRDLTGLPGPAGWSLGTYPEGKADHPVSGVSWYEAAAYAEFVGKALPTVYEWRQASPISVNFDVVLLSNFTAKTTAPVGAFHGMSAFGAYDMAGNVKEWTINPTGTLRYALGGGWSESTYTFFGHGAVDPFTRTTYLGFRLVKRVTKLPDSAYAPLQLHAPPGPVRREKPVSDEAYREFVDLHNYERGPLDDKIDLVDNSHPLWTRETVSFRAAYDDRVKAHLFLPRRFSPPYQVVAVLGGIGINQATRIEDFPFPYEFLLASGRAVVIPAFAGTLERGPSPNVLPPNEEGVRSLKWFWDLARTIDYLETRPDVFDTTKLGFYGLSLGAMHAPRLLAVDKRFKAAALISGGLGTAPRAFDAWNYAPHYKVPTLMINGKHDVTFPYETNQLVLFNALGTAPADKKLSSFDGGHANPVTLPDKLAEIIAWFDRYLGKVQELQLTSK